MRVFSALLKRGHPTEPVPFQEILPLKLKPVVSGKGGKTSDVCCIHEMSVMLSCFKENEFDQSFCSKEVEAFRKCYDNHMEMKKVKKAKDAKGLLTPEQKVLSHKQVNRLLKQFPNIK